MPTLYTVSFDKMFGETDAGGKWVVRGKEFAPAAKENRKSDAVDKAREMAEGEDVVEVRNKDGSLNRRFNPQT